MLLVWLYSLVQCVLSVSVIWMSIRLCMAGPRPNVGDKSVSACLKLCLGWAGALGGALEVPINMLLNLRIRQCLYTCITLLCCPLLVRHFTVWLLLLLIFNLHLQCRLGLRYAKLVTRQRMLCLLLLIWVCSVVTAFAQFIVSSSLDNWVENGAIGLEFEELGKPSNPNGSNPNSHPKNPAPRDRSVIGKYLPYGGFLSKFLADDMHNFTYAQLHSDHWGVCAFDMVLSPVFLVYIHAVTVFLVPMLVLLALYLDLMCVMPRQANMGHVETQKRNLGQARVVILSLSLLVLLCLPFHTIHFLRLYAPGSQSPFWVTTMASILFQSYSLVPPLLFIQFLENIGGGPMAVTPLSSVKNTSKQLKSKSCTLLDFCLPAPPPQGIWGDDNKMPTIASACHAAPAVETNPRTAGF